MVFDSVTFLIFFALFIGPYHALWRWWRWQNVVLLAASSVFYGWWDWRFLGLMFGTSFVDFVSGIWLGRLTDERRRKWVLGFSVGLNLAVLFLFKYFNFFADSF